MSLPFPFDWKNPDYAQVFAWRLERLGRIRRAIEREREENQPPETLPALRAFYRDNPAQFVIDWGMTYDPRKAGVDKPTSFPFILYPRQEEWFDYAVRKWRAGENACTPKSRELGVSWCACTLAATLGVTHDGINVGFGSRVEDLVDKRGSPDSLFWKIRFFLENLPVEFRAGWKARGDAHMRVAIPDTGSVILGEGGNQIGRGGRQSMYFTDEDAFLADADSIDASLSMTTENRHRISSFNGTGNSFYRTVTEGKVELFNFHWRDDPRKDDAWYDRKSNDLPAHIVASEIDMDPAASIDRIVIPPAWVRSSVDAHKKLGIVPSGGRRGALDVADEGRDKNAYCGTYGNTVERCEEWSGVGDDLMITTQKAFTFADMDGADGFDYDADGLGAGIRGDARVLNEGRMARGQPLLIVAPWRASNAVAFPTRPIPTIHPVDPLDSTIKRTNEDFFDNAGVQAWYELRIMFHRTHRAVTEGAPFTPDGIISLSSELPQLKRIMLELSQPQFADHTSKTGKMLIDKMPEGTRSPNLADAIKIRFAPKLARAAAFFDLPSGAASVPSQPVGAQSPNRSPRGRTFR